MSTSRSESPDLAHFLLAQPELQEADPSRTRVVFDLDETLFRRFRPTYTGPDTRDTLRGSWRPDAPHIFDVLGIAGFRDQGILSSASVGYIAAATEIYVQQFGSNTPQAFESIASTRDYSDLGMKSEALPLYVEETAADGQHVIYVDDTPTYFDGPQPANLRVLVLPREFHYLNATAPLFAAPLQ